MLSFVAFTSVAQTSGTEANGPPRHPSPSGRRRQPQLLVPPLSGHDLFSPPWRGGLKMDHVEPTSEPHSLATSVDQDGDEGGGAVAAPMANVHASAHLQGIPAAPTTVLGPHDFLSISSSRNAAGGSHVSSMRTPQNAVTGNRRLSIGLLQSSLVGGLGGTVTGLSLDESLPILMQSLNIGASTNLQASQLMLSQAASTLGGLLNPSTDRGRGSILRQQLAGAWTTEQPTPEQLAVSKSQGYQTVDGGGGGWGEFAPGLVPASFTDSIEGPSVFLRRARCGPSARFGHVAVVIPAPAPMADDPATHRDDHVVLVHGGRDSSAYLDDIWLYYPSTGKWRQIPRPEDSTVPWPSGRSGHTATMMPSGHILIYGGAVTHEVTSSELWELDPAAPFRWRLCDRGEPRRYHRQHPSGYPDPARPPMRPVNRKGHTAVCIEGVLYLYGGATQDCVPDPDVWSWDPRIRRWAPMPVPSGEHPWPRRYHCAEATVHGEMIIFGGQQVRLPPNGSLPTTASVGGPCLSDVHIFNPRHSYWRPFEVRGPIAPEPRMCATMLCRSDALVVFDGADLHHVMPNSHYELDLLHACWSRVPLPTIPKPHGANRGSVSMLGNTAVMFGGHTGTEFASSVVQLRLEPPRLRSLAARWLLTHNPQVLDALPIADRLSPNNPLALLT
jgi:hypothetical protein